MSKECKYYWIGAILLFVGLFLNLSFGSVRLSFEQVYQALFISDDKYAIIVKDIRLVRFITAIFSGAALGVAGLQMQTLFRNPLAGPFVLGISTGASLGVAVYLLGGTIIGLGTMAYGSTGMIISSNIGALIVMGIILASSKRINDNISLLIIGLMLGSITGALVGFLQFTSSAESLQNYIIWTLGSLSGLNWNQLTVFVSLLSVGLIGSFALKKGLPMMLMGDDYAKSMGLSVRRYKIWLIICCCLLAGTVTSFCGPIAFIGIAIPHFVRFLTGVSSPGKLLPLVLLYGGALLCWFDWIAALPGSTETIPINIITSLFGAPMIILLILKRRRVHG